ncbi:unnamed protein product [Owenia fusiformis]|uniref:Uncharacterized protein n=1 Tax=Owenia fusiformis TaxID=6347 RepID=A0A8J1U1R5_OWEFU|nr:unnamed protein product [Owenia fusiformis]
MSNFLITTSGDGRRNINDDDNGKQYSRGGPQRRGRGRGGGNNNYRGNKGRGGYRGRGGGGPNPRSRIADEDDEGDVDMGDSGASGSRNNRKYNPYGNRPPTRRGDRPGGGKAYMDNEAGGSAGVMSRLGLPVQRGGGNRGRGRGNSRGNSKNYDNRKNDYIQPSEQWFKVLIPHGKKGEKSFILREITKLSAVPFVPINYHYEGEMVVFYVQGRTEANAVRDVTRRITLPNGFKMIILTKFMPKGPEENKSYSKPMSEEQIEKMKISMSKRYDPATQTLDMSDFFNDTDLNNENIRVVLNRPNPMENFLKIVKENIPETLSLNLSDNRLMSLGELGPLKDAAPGLKSLNLSNNSLKSDYELDKIKGLMLEELQLDGNPLCDRYQDQPQYISAIRKRFPKVIKLDGEPLAAPITFDLETPTRLPPRKESYFFNSQAQDVVTKFIKQYYDIYDSESRQGLLEAYHENALFSISCANNPSIQGNQPFLNSYIQDSRNLQKVYNSDKRMRLLKQGKLNVVAFLTNLPKTKHDMNSLVVDVNHISASLLSFTVNGVFKETDSKTERPPIRQFSRMFVTIPQAGGIAITNDEITYSNASHDQMRSAFKTPAPTPSHSPVQDIPGPSLLSSPVPTPINPASIVTPPGLAGTQFTEIQLQMIQQFSQQSGMNQDWSMKCLAQNDWDFEKSAQVFTDLRNKGSIPPEAFVKS